MNDVNKKNWSIALLWMVILVLILGGVGYFYKDNISEYMFGPKVEDITIVKNDSVEEPLPTIDEILQVRRETIEEKKSDSIFLSLSEVELTAILMKIGTNSTIKEIVDAYKNLQPYLKNVLLGADIAEKMLQEQQKKPLVEPDSIPKTSVPSK